MKILDSSYISLKVCIARSPFDYIINIMGGSRAGYRGSGPPLKNHKNIGFLSNTGPGPLKITNPAFNVG